MKRVSVAGTWSPAFRLIQKCRLLSCGVPPLFPANTRAILNGGNEETEIPPLGENLHFTWCSA